MTDLAEHSAESAGGGKVVMITGAASGIGEAAARRFARSGCRVGLVDIDSEKGESLAGSMSARGHSVFFVSADVSQGADVSSAVERIVSHFGALDYAFNNAGIAVERPRHLCEWDEKDWDTMMNINLRSIWLSLKYQGRYFMESGRQGAIVNTSSIMSHFARPGISAYCAAKAGINGLTRAAAMDFRGTGVRVNAICPGLVSTAMTGSEEMSRRLAPMLSRVPLARLAAASEIADAAYWLCSDQASYIHGQCISVDGGFSVA